MIGSIGTPQKLMLTSQTIIVLFVWDALNTCMATELQQFKFQIDNKSKSFKICVLISPLFLFCQFLWESGWSVGVDFFFNSSVFLILQIIVQEQMLSHSFW